MSDLHRPCRPLSSFGDTFCAIHPANDWPCPRATPTPTDESEPEPERHDPRHHPLYENIAAKIRDAYYHSRDHGGTMHTASYDAAVKVIALLPHPPSQPFQAPHASDLTPWTLGQPWSQGVAHVGYRCTVTLAHNAPDPVTVVGKLHSLTEDGAFVLIDEVGIAHYGWPALAITHLPRPTKDPT